MLKYFNMFKYMRENMDNNTLLLDMVEEFGEKDTQAFMSACGVCSDDFQRVLIIEKEEKEK